MYPVVNTPTINLPGVRHSVRQSSSRSEKRIPGVQFLEEILEEYYIHSGLLTNQHNYGKYDVINIGKSNITLMVY